MKTFFDWLGYGVPFFLLGMSGLAVLLFDKWEEARKK
jgi:hypothetical protein